MPFILSFYGTCEDGTGGPNNASSGSAPTGVSIASAATGNYDNAVSAEETASSFSAMDVAASGFSSNTATKNVSVGTMALHSWLSGFASIKVYGYIRATGATSFQWDMSTGGETNLTAGTASTSGTPSTSQDELSGGIDETAVLTFGSGRGGYIFPSAGDEWHIVISASATNSNGTTDAADVDIIYAFVS